MPEPGSPPTDNRQVEFDELQKQQWEALDRAIYFCMTAQEARDYENRARWIVEFSALVVNLRIPPR